MRESKDNPYQIFYDNYLTTNACTECTGLIPFLSNDVMEWDSYRDVFDFEAVPEKVTISKDSER